MRAILYTATIPKLGPNDDQGPYFWLSVDSQKFLEVESLPAPEEVADWYRQVTEEATRKTGLLRMKVDRRLLEYGGAEFGQFDVR